MSHLIQLRRRINVVETTIKKTMNAMRLISMSLHSRLRQNKVYLEAYRSEIKKLVALLPNFQSNQELIGDKQLIIVIGSQKGLCGTFNINLFHFFGSEEKNEKKSDIIAIGKQIADYLKNKNIELRAVYNNFSAQNYQAIAHELTQLILYNNEYSSVIVYHNVHRTFFIQKPTKTLLFPFSPEIKDGNSSDTKPEQEYIWEQPADTIIESVKELYVNVSLQELLFDSLLAEQAARFISTDTAVRNADTLLNEMKLDYNKLRQALITRELTDLTASLSNNN